MTTRPVMECLGRLPAAEGLALLRAARRAGHRTMDVLGVAVSVRGLRLATFARDGDRCSMCQRPATWMQVERDPNPQGTGQTTAHWHVQVYHDTGKGGLIRFTHDHTLARCLGGTNQLSNTTTMCARCNLRKAQQEHQELMRRQFADPVAAGHGALVPSPRQTERLLQRWREQVERFGQGEAAFRQHCETMGAHYIATLKAQGLPGHARRSKARDRVGRVLALSPAGVRYFRYAHNRAHEADQNTALG